MVASSTTSPAEGIASVEKRPTGAIRSASRRRIVVSFLLLGACAAVASYVSRALWYEETDDAQIDGDISSVSPRVAGNVAKVLVSENDRIEAGAVIAEIDTADLGTAVAHARALLAEAQAELEVEDPAVNITVSTNQSAESSLRSDLLGAQAALSAARKEVERTTAQVAEAIANDRTAQLEKDRSQKLVSLGAVTQSDYDTKSNTAAASAANVAALQEALAAVRERVMERESQMRTLGSQLFEVVSNSPRRLARQQAAVVKRRADVDAARADLEQAERNLAYARVLAPVSGIVAKKSFAVGDHVVPGQEIVSIAQTDDLWVTANYRETQLTRIRRGQSVEVHVDALGLDYRGVVESVGGATGSRVSVLPPENASGNYVKVVQRLPVRIRLDRGQPGLEDLRIGMSVEPQIRVR